MQLRYSSAGVIAVALAGLLPLQLYAHSDFESQGPASSTVQTSSQSVTLVRSPATVGGPLAKGIADIQAIISRDRRLAQALNDSVMEHLQNMGEIIYGAYGQKEDPAVHLIELKQAYDGVHSAVVNGVTGQVWQALGQLGQALLDCASDSTCLPAPNYQVGQDLLKGMNVLQQIGWESARLETTLSELNAYNAEIATDTGIEQTLEQKNVEIQARQDPNSTNSDSDTTPLATDDPVLPIIPAGTNLSALDDALLMLRWMDLGNRAFANKDEEDRFYARFPALQRFKTIAETYAPITEVEAFIARCGSISTSPSTSSGDRPGSPPQSVSMAQQIAGVGAYFGSVNKRAGCPNNPPK